MIDIRIEIKHEIREAFKKLYNYSCSLDLISIDDTPKNFEGFYTLIIFPHLKKLNSSPDEVGNSIGKYLIENGMQQGSLVGKALKEIEEEWIKNNFQITKERVKEIIHSYAN